MGQMGQNLPQMGKFFFKLPQMGQNPSWRAGACFRVCQSGPGLPGRARHNMMRDDAGAILALPLLSAVLCRDRCY
jgi:hypothetical protein